jgi:nucleoside-diphosphate-sugar epimerase
MPSTSELLGTRQRILVTGGAGFIGGAVVRRLLRESDAIVFNLDKMGYASDLTSIEEVIKVLGVEHQERHQVLPIDLCDAEAVQQAVKVADPDLVMHLAAESHVDRSISGPGVFIESNVTGTYNLLQAVRSHFEATSRLSVASNSACITSAQMKCLAPSVVKGRFQKQRLTTLAVPTQQAKQQATIWCKRGTTRSDFPSF